MGLGDYEYFSPYKEDNNNSNNKLLTSKISF